MDSTAAKIIDLIATPATPGGPSLRDQWGRTAIEVRDYEDPVARSEEFELELQGGRDPNQPSEVPMAVRTIQPYVIPLFGEDGRIGLRQIVTRLEKRR